MEHVNCNLCGSTELRAVYEMPDVKFYPDEWFTIVECAGCGLGFVNPRPTREEIGKYYPAGYFDYLAPELHQQRYAREAAYLASYGTSDRSGRLLDVGCANGDFPRFMKARGWDVEGVEVAAATNPVTDFPIHTSEFPAASLAPESFDAVTAWAVLEHVHDPKAYFQRAREVLKDDGVFIFNVPNFGSLASRRLYREDVPRHLYFFAESTVRRYLELSGFELVEAVYGADVYEMLPTNWLRYLLFYAPFGRHLAFDDLPEHPETYFRRLGIPQTLVSKLRYAVTHPMATVDGLLRPLHVRWSIARRSYGMVTFVARKAGARLSA